MAGKRKASGKSRRARGTGSIFYDKRRDRWISRTIVGTKPDGSPQYVTRSAKTQAELLPKMANLRAPGPKTTAGAWATSWLESLDLSPNTVRNYKFSVAGYILPLLGRIPLAALTPHQIEHAARVWLNTPKPRKNLPGGAPRSVNTVLLVLSHLRTMLAAAVRAGLIPTNPAGSAKKPKSVKKKLDPFTAEELAAIVAEGAKHPRGYILAFLAATGAREGEAIALNVSDYDAVAGTVSITKGFRGSKLGVGKPKTAGSVRTITMPPQIVPVLDAAVAGRESGYLFPSTTARPKNHSALLWPWRAMLKRLNIRERNVHQLRHAFISCAVAAGLPIADVARYVGNSAAVIIRTYLHPRGADVAGAMGAVLGRR